MSTPAYITEENVYYSDVTTQAALLLDGPIAWMLPYCNLVTEIGRTDLDTLVKVNGGSLQLKSEDIARTTMLDNGRSWYDTYIGTTRYVDRTQLPTYDQAHGGGGGGGGDYILPVASPTILGGVRITSQSGIVINGKGQLSVDPTTFPPSGVEGQVLTSKGANAPPSWQHPIDDDVDGGEY